MAYSGSNREQRRVSGLNLARLLLRQWHKAGGFWDAVWERDWGKRATHLPIVWCDLQASPKRHSYDPNPTQPRESRKHLAIGVATCRWPDTPPRTILPGFLPQALVAQRIEQKTFLLQTPPLHRTIYRVVGEKWRVVRWACNKETGLFPKSPPNSPVIQTPASSGWCPTTRVSVTSFCSSDSRASPGAVMA